VFNAGDHIMVGHEFELPPVQFHVFVTHAQVNEHTLTFADFHRRTLLASMLEPIAQLHDPARLKFLPCLRRRPKRGIFKGTKVERLDQNPVAKRMVLRHGKDSRTNILTCKDT